VEDAPLTQRLRDGATYIRTRIELRRLLSAYVLVSVLAATIVPLEVIFVTRSLGASEAAFGIVVALWGAGSVLGSALLSVIRGAPLRVLVCSSFAVMGASYLGMGIATSLAVVCSFSFVGGISNGIEVFAALTAIQEQTSEQFQARVNGFVEALMAAAFGFGFVLGPALATVASVRVVYWLAGGGIVAVAATVVPRCADLDRACAREVARTLI
jgi:MFS family permease